MKTFGELLRDFRQRRKLTQQDLADRLGLSSPYIAQMESGFKPPPPNVLVDKMLGILQLSFEEKRRFQEFAEREREVQSLTKATRKIGYVLAGNKVCVPQKIVSYRTQQEIDDLVDTIPHTVVFSIDVSGKVGPYRGSGAADVLKNHDDLRSWALTEMGDQPHHWLAFLGMMYDILLLTPDERLLCRQPSGRRKEIANLSNDIGKFFSGFRAVIEESRQQAEEQKLPNVIAPHDAWQNIDEMLGLPGEANVEMVSGSSREDGAILNIPIIGEIPPGSDEFEERHDLGLIGLPRDWFDGNKRYEACFVQTDAYVSLGVWPGCKAIYELNAPVENEDLAVVQLGDRRCLRKYFDMGEQIFLQGGPLARPIHVSKTETSVQVVGVVRELVSRFKELRS
ncbi:MAG: helix-turn-helix domain-containing protein [Candidatus Omnitrophota bacterium]